jgi:hypothetical protein
LGLGYSLLQNQLTASLSFALEDEKSGGGLGALGLASSFGYDLGGGGGVFLLDLTELFKSRAMVEQTLLSPVTSNGKVISLAEMYIQNAGWRKWNENQI